MAIGAVSAISGSSRQIIWKASKPVSDRVRPEPGWHRNIIAVSNYPPARTTLPPPFTGVEQFSDDVRNPQKSRVPALQILESGLRFESTTKGVLVGKARHHRVRQRPRPEAPVLLRRQHRLTDHHLQRPQASQEFFRNSSPHVARTKQSS